MINLLSQLYLFLKNWIFKIQGENIMKIIVYIKFKMIYKYIMNNWIN